MDNRADKKTSYQDAGVDIETLAVAPEEDDEDDDNDNEENDNTF